MATCSESDNAGFHNRKTQKGFKSHLSVNQGKLTKNNNLIGIKVNIIIKKMIILKKLKVLILADSDSL